MNTPAVPSDPPVELLHPELWLLLTDGADPDVDAAAVHSQLQALATSNLLAAWRTQHHRVRAISRADLGAQLHQALHEGCPAVHLHASLTADELDDLVDALSLPSSVERRVNLQGWGEPFSAWWPAVADELTQPDTWVEVGWRLSGGRTLPSVIVPGDDAAMRDYVLAIKAWRAERFKLGDSGEIPGVSGNEEDEEPTSLPESGQLPIAAAYVERADDEEVRLLAPWPTASTWQTPVHQSTRVLAARGVLSASSSDSSPGTPWWPVVTLHVIAQSPDRTQRWACKLLIERQSTQQDGPWLVVRARLEWAEEARTQAMQHAWRLCLLPRLQVPVSVDFAKGLDKAYIPGRGGAMASMREWDKALPNTPATLVLLPENEAEAAS